MKQLIYDIGMHNGRDTEFYLRKGFKVVAVEANPLLVENAKSKFQVEIKKGDLIIVDKAIAEKSGEELKFYVNKSKDDWGTALKNWNRTMSDDFTEILVQSVALEDIIERYGMPYYMKIDIEGMDGVCLKSLQKFVNKPEYISAELITANNLPGQDVDALEILCYLRALGYRKFKISDQSKNGDVKCPNPAKEGIYVDYQFNGENSGLFGKELEGEIFNIDKISQLYLDYFYLTKKKPSKITQKLLGMLNKTNQPSVFHQGGWFDVHASL